MAVIGTGAKRFNPKGNTVRPTGWRRRRAIQTFALCLSLSTGMSVAAAGPAFAETLVVSTKAVSGPRGFRGVCARYAWACDLSNGGTVRGADAELALANKINRAVNRSVREVSDQRQYRRKEYWTLPTTGRGDCEDFALQKRLELMRAGVAPGKVLIATVLDRRRQAHAVLVIRTAKGDYVLDNLNSKLKPWRKTGYSFIRMQDPRSPSGWTMVMKGGVFQA